MMNQKKRYKVNFISTFLGPVVEAKKLVKIITNTQLDDKKLVKTR